MLVFLLFGLFHLRSAYAQNGELLCSPQTAYARGMVDAQQGRWFKKNYGDNCPEIMQKNLQQFYLQGYKAGGGNPDEKHQRRPRRGKSERKCIFTPTAQQICGYDCVKSITQAKCATRPDQNCVVGHFDEVACGFHCIAGNDKVYCAQRQSDRCIRDNFGNVKCGKNCRVNNFNLQCDIERYAKS